MIPRPDVWSNGAAAPWRELHDPERPLTTAQVLDAVVAAGGPYSFDPPPGTKPSAVLIALVDGPNGAEVLLTRRSWELRNHRGEVSFPGGRMDPGETPLEAALREAHEEVGLAPALVEPAGELDHLLTIVSSSYIVPVVARLAERPDLRPATVEVDRILFVPLVELTRPDTHREERWGTPPHTFPIQFFELDDETVWGATARLLSELLRISYGL